MRLPARGLGRFISPQFYREADEPLSHRLIHADWAEPERAAQIGGRVKVRLCLHSNQQSNCQCEDKRSDQKQHNHLACRIVVHQVHFEHGPGNVQISYNNQAFLGVTLRLRLGYAVDRMEGLC